MQDDATPHTANETLKLLKQKFGNRVISRRKNYPWAAHISDHNPIDFFLWRYAKDLVYAEKLKSLQELKPATPNFIKVIPTSYVQESYWKPCSQAE